VEGGTVHIYTWRAAAVRPAVLTYVPSSGRLLEAAACMCLKCLLPWQLAVLTADRGRGAFSTYTTQPE
jgi:hypothetical protein